MTNKTNGWIPYIATVAMLLAVEHGAFAQSRPVIEEIVVTATKRETDLQDTAGAVTALSEQSLGFREINSLGDLRTQVPNMNYSEISGSPLISIRGIGQSLETGVGDAAVASHIDGVYLPRPGQVSAAAIDLSRIEVLRGPQGTLYGRNATGGVINNVQAAPSGEFEFGAKWARGSFGRQRWKAYVSGPLMGDVLSARVAYSDQRYGGEGRNLEEGYRLDKSETKAIRGIVRFSPSDNLTWDLSAFKHEFETVGPWYTALNQPEDLLGNPIPPSDYTNQRNRTRSNIKPHSDRYTKGAISTLTWDTEYVSVKSVTGYLDHEHFQHYGPDETSQFIFDTKRVEQSKTISQEFNFSGELFGRLDWLVGAYYFQDDATLELPTFANIGLVSLPVLGEVGALVFLEQKQVEDNRAYAAFMDATLSITDYLRLNAGVRMGREIKKVTQDYSSTIQTDVGFDIPVGEACHGAKLKQAVDSTDPKVTVQWDISDNIMSYVQYQTAIKSGGFNISACNNSYDPEKVTSVEFGVKSTWMDRRLTVNLTAFNYSYDDFQVFQINGIAADIKNAASVTSRGVELELMYHLNRYVSMDLNASWLDAVFDEYSDRDGFRNTALVIFPSNAPVEDLSGNQLVRTPNYSYTVGVNLTVPIDRLGLGDMMLRLENYGTDEFYFRPFNNPEDRQKPYNLFNAFLGLTSSDGRFTAKLYAKNILDEEYFTAIFPIPNIKLYNGSYGESRSFGVEFGYAY